MSLVQVNGYPVFAGSIELPLVGVWTADLDLDADKELTGTGTIAIAEGESLVGTVVAGDLRKGYLRARIVGGAAGMAKLAKPKHYVAPTLGLVLKELASGAGEKVSPRIQPAVLSTPLLAWTTMAMPTGAQLAALVASGRPGASWRILADGTLWVGDEAWPESDIPEWSELERRPADRAIELGLDTPSLLPGMVLGDDRIGAVLYVIGRQGVRTTAWQA